MIGYLKGIITEVSQQGWVLIVVNNVGYQVYMSEKDRSLIDRASDAEIFTEMIVRETEISLYGFISKQDLSMFKILNEVSGIGPKSAMTMISCVESSLLAEAIISENMAVLTKLPGIGKKTAQRMILDVKEKLQKPEGTVTGRYSSELPQQIDTGLMTTVFDTLSALGYNDKEIISVIPDIEKNQNLSEQEMIKLALRSLTQKK